MVLIPQKGQQGRREGQPFRLRNGNKKANPVAFSVFRRQIQHGGKTSFQRPGARLGKAGALPRFSEKEMLNSQWPFHIAPSL